MSAPVVAALIPTVRPEMLRDLLDSWHLGDTEGIQLHVLAQREDQQAFLRVIVKHPELLPLLHFTYQPEGGPMWPKRAGYLRDHAAEADAWLLLDDDMVLLEGMTHWRPAIDRALDDPSVGVVSCNWARSAKLVPRKWPPHPEERKRWVKEPVINIGGGLAMRREVAELIGSYHPEVPWMFDGTMYGLVPYLEGFTNWRYLGSVVIHRILAPGGMKAVRSRYPLVLLPEEFIYCPPSSDIYKGELAVNNVNIPASSNLTAAARELHRRRRSERGF